MKQDQAFLLNNAKLIKKMYQYILFNFFIYSKKIKIMSYKYK